MTLSQKYKRYLKELDGQEIRSLYYEDVIAVDGNKIISYGKVIDTIDTDAKVKRLISEAYYDEFGTYDVSKSLF